MSDAMCVLIAFSSGLTGMFLLWKMVLWVAVYGHGPSFIVSPSKMAEDGSSVCRVRWANRPWLPKKEDYVVLPYNRESMSMGELFFAGSGKLLNPTQDRGFYIGMINRDEEVDRDARFEDAKVMLDGPSDE